MLTGLPPSPTHSSSPIRARSRSAAKAAHPSSGPRRRRAGGGSVTGLLRDGEWSTREVLDVTARIDWQGWAWQTRPLQLPTRLRTKLVAETELSASGPDGAWPLRCVEVVGEGELKPISERRRRPSAYESPSLGSWRGASRGTFSGALGGVECYRAPQVRAEAPSSLAGREQRGRSRCAAGDRGGRRRGSGR
jgi:hypothetical protein